MYQLGWDYFGGSPSGQVRVRLILFLLFRDYFGGSPSGQVRVRLILFLLFRVRLGSVKVGDRSGLVQFNLWLAY